MSKLSPFDIVNHLNEKTNIEMDPSDYAPWMINLALANHLQTILFANEMNRLYDLPKEVQYDFYFHGIPKGKRFGKWPKREKYDTELVSIVQERFALNILRAQQYISLLSKEQIEWLKQAHGGK